MTGGLLSPVQACKIPYANNDLLLSWDWSVFVIDTLVNRTYCIFGYE